MEKWKCLRCGYEWLPRIEKRPKKCPNCQNREWDTPRPPSGRKRKTE